MKKRLHELSSEEIISLKERLLSKISKKPESACWEWQGAITSRGYGSISIGGKVGKGYSGRLESTHTASLFAFKGIAVPEGKVTNHRCENKKCINPGHLQVATVRENNLYSDSPFSQNAAKTHCPQGHELFGSNVRIHKQRGTRICLTCRREKDRAARARGEKR